MHALYVLTMIRISMAYGVVEQVKWGDACFSFTLNSFYSWPHFLSYFSFLGLSPRTTRD